MLMAALFTIAKICKQPKCPPTDEWTKMIWCIHTDIDRNNTQPYKRMKFYHLQQCGYI